MDGLLSPRLSEAVLGSQRLPRERAFAFHLGQCTPQQVRAACAARMRVWRFAGAGATVWAGNGGRSVCVARNVLSAGSSGGYTRPVASRRQTEEESEVDMAMEDTGEITFAQRPEKRPQPRISQKQPEVEPPVGTGPASEEGRSFDSNVVGRQASSDVLSDRNLPAGAVRLRKPLRSRLSAAVGSASNSSKDRRSLGASVPIVKDSTLVNIRFSIQFHVDYGQSLRVVGSHESLGAWSIHKAPSMQWSKGDVWHVSVQLPAGSVYEYKYAVVGADSQSASLWQSGNNCVLAVTIDKEDIDVFDNWEGLPGASVISGGDVTTREKCLLSWATEMERHLKSSASSLQKVTLRLQEAQEAAQLARQESSRLRAELRVESVARRAAEQQVRELELLNRQLKAQLQEQHFLSRKVMKEALRLLTEAIEDRDDDPVDRNLDRANAALPNRTATGKDPEQLPVETPPVPPAVAGIDDRAEAENALFSKNTSQKDRIVAKPTDIANSTSNGVVEEESDRRRKGRKVIV